MVTTRVSVEIFGPVPITTLHATAEIVRAGKRITLSHAELADGDGRVLASANVWRMRKGATDPGPGSTPPNPFIAEPEAAPPMEFNFGTPPNWASSIEFRSVSGGFTSKGPAQIWMRSRIDLVKGTGRDPVEDVLTCVDAGSGISRELDFDWTFINVDLTMHLARQPLGGWVGMDSMTSFGSDGRGVAGTKVFDTDGFVGYSNQSLFVEPR